MQRKIIHLLLMHIIFYSVCVFGTTEGMVGRSVREADEGEFPNVVCIVRFSNHQQFLRNNVKCTGTLIKHDLILTSEHCFENMGIRALHVLVGSRDLRLATKYYIFWWITYNMWATSENLEIEFFHNDIAVMKLLEAVPETIVPAPILFSINSRFFGSQVTLAGWGKVDDNLNPYILHTVSMIVISNEDCQIIAERILGEFLPVHDRYLCSFSDPPAILTPGDSGGPILINNQLIGVNQGTCPRTDNNLDFRKANIHCGVDYYTVFINNMMNHS